MPREDDRPRYRDQRPWFEIWFAVVIDADRARAAWIRQTLLVPAEGPSRATIWAAWFDANATPPARARKRILELSAVRAGTGDILVHHDDCTLGYGRANGRCGELGWNLTWSGGEVDEATLPEWLPAPTHARALAHEADATGTVTVGDAPFEVHGRAIAMHLWGTKRVPTLQWIWAPHLGDDAASDDALEMTAVSLQSQFSLGLSSLRIDGAHALRGRPASAAYPTGLVTATVAGLRELVHVRAWAEPDEMVGYAYRDTDGRDLMIAQSDAGSAHVEVWRRTLPGAPWKPAGERHCRGGVAVEIHQRDPLPEVAYIGWDDEVAPARAAAAAAEPAADEVAWPDVRDVVALGLTYKDHVEETGEAAPAEPAAFVKHARSVAVGGGELRVPTAAAVCEAAEEAEPTLGGELGRRLPDAPAVMDYEGEVAVVALGDIDDAALAAGTPQPLGFAAANDLTARLVQVLGDGRPRKLDYWARAKSFAGFLPLAPRVWAPAGGVATMPELVVETRVNGVPRQRASTRELVYDLATMLRAARTALGRPLARGDVVLTGTPAGVGAALSPLRRQIAKRITDRFRRAELLVSSYATSAALLRPGDVVEVSAGSAGRVRTRLVT
jgi:2-keto-4-pentenoate hydratase/2-oxohepta-3-ene-1,7-dioic acid hydratase in catechol pathway